MKLRNVPVRDALTLVIGEGATDAFLRVMTHVSLEETASSAPKRYSREGVPYTAPRTAVAPLEPTRQRDEDSEPVRAAAIALLSIAAYTRPEQHRVNHSALYVGDPTGKRFCGLGAETRRSNRELQRYFAAWRSHGVGAPPLQPPSDTPGVRKSRKGRTYNVFIWREVPRELAEIAQAWADALAKQERGRSRQLARDPAPPPPRAPAKGSSGAALAAKLLGQGEQPPGDTGPPAGA